MSYCVNCGVELRDSERSCPLCSVPVNNPAQPWSEPKSMPYPRRVDRIIDTVDRRYGAGLAGLILLVPAAITVITDILTSGAVSWSAYVVGALVMLSVFILVPMVFKAPRVQLFIALDALAVLAFLFLIEVSSGGAWFLRLGLPVVLIAASSALVMLTVFRSRSTGALIKASVALLEVSVLCVALNLVINAFIDRPLFPHWALYAAIPCVILSIILFYTERHEALKEKIRKRLFY